MVTDMRGGARKASVLLKSLANENRLKILCALVDGQKNVGELESILRVRQPTLSQQLARLRSDKLVSTRRASKQIYYRISSDEALEVVGLLHDLFCNDATKAETPFHVAAE
ncbi:MAG: Transcriptional activator HlyU [Alphaproteobacteria bacterium MarineAlpha3_Bin5]|nr:transcriptional regulator [Magnetovibrio sp.]PPR79408.1 MAG: Transcriptional activator HlyU [Alphaproteobacteria bacterium MarineAlpha3_Bin5]|tara:strand:- start:199 stop:531 length:333 start_codon:yes stop_codon:yes gene_type:complete